MNDAAVMGVLKPAGNLLCKGQNLLKGDPPLAVLMRSANVGPSTSSITSARAPFDSSRP
jgi:hypothetical protein